MESTFFWYYNYETQINATSNKDNIRLLTFVTNKFVFRIRQRITTKVKKIKEKVLLYKIVKIWWRKKMEYYILVCKHRKRITFK